MMNRAATSRSGREHSGLVLEILDCLEKGTPVRRDLPGGGRVHIDRPLPFLCVHAMGATDHVAAFDVVTANAAYVIAPELGAAAPIVDAVGRAMRRRFGAFLAIEVSELDEDRLLAPDSPYLPAFETIVTLQDRPAVRSAADAFARAMAEAPVKYRSPRVEPRVADAQGWSAGLDPAIAQLAIAFAPIYRQPKTGRLYPDLRRRLVATVFDALLRACAAFLASAGATPPPSHRALGRRMFIEAVERVDRRIDQIARSFDFLLAITPINADAAWQEFRSSRFAVAPRLLYRPLTVEVDVEKRRLFSIPFANLEDPLLYELYRQKQQELDLLLTMIAARETPQFREASRVLYGSVEPGLLNEATGVLATAPAGRPAADPVDCHHVRREAHRMIRAYRGSGMRFPARVSLRSDLPAGLLVSGPRLLISRSTLMPRGRVEALLSHEVGVHLFTYFAGDAQGLRLFRSGLAGYDGLQEGLAVLAEYLAGGMTAARLRLVAARVVGCAAMLDGAEFPETFRTLTRERGLSQTQAFDVTLRVHRSGGLAKDAIYLRGLLGVLGHLRRGGSLDPFWLGKISEAHLPVIEDLRARGLLRPPPVRPTFLSHPGAAARLAAARAGLSPADLLAA
jgi:uncharacterized protein (TIGR02421 family)